MNIEILTNKMSAAEVIKIEERALEILAAAVEKRVKSEEFPLIAEECLKIQSVMQIAKIRGITKIVAPGIFSMPKMTKISLNEEMDEIKEMIESLNGIEIDEISDEFSGIIHATKNEVKAAGDLLFKLEKMDNYQSGQAWGIIEMIRAGLDQKMSMKKIIAAIEERGNATGYLDAMGEAEECEFTVSGYSQVTYAGSHRSLKFIDQIACLKALCSKK